MRHEYDFQHLRCKTALFASDYNFEAIHESLNILCFVNFLIVIPMKINMRQILKNIPKEEVPRLADLIDVRPGEIVSKTLAQNDCVSITLFAFDKGEEIGTHDSTGEAMVAVLEGAGSFTVGGEAHIVKAGETLVMPAKIPHSVFAIEPFKWILTVVFPK